MTRRRFPLLLLVAAIPAAVALSLFVGSNPVPPSDVWAALTGGGDPTAAYVVDHQRLPAPSRGSSSGWRSASRVR
ncbi:hypothetical protein [Nocardioides zeae]